MTTSSPRARARKGRHRRPLFLIDIAVPRDIESSVAEARRRLPLRPRRPPGGGGGQPARAHEGGGGGGGAHRPRGATSSSTGSRPGTRCPSWSRSAQRAEDIRQAELEKARRRMGPLTPEQEEALDAATTAIVNKLLHSPIVHLKESAQNGHGPEQVEPHPEAPRPVSRSGPSASAPAAARSPSGRRTTWRGACAPPATASRSSASRPPATASSTAPRDRRGQGGLPEGDRGGAGRPRGRPRRAQPEGRAHRAARRPRPVRVPAPRGPARRGALARRADALRPEARGARRAPPACAAQALIKELRKDLVIEDLRGNVDSRIRRLREGKFDAILLAMAGLIRLGRAGRGGGGAEPGAVHPRARARASSPSSAAPATPRCMEAAAPLHDPATARGVEAERARARRPRRKLQRAHGRLRRGERPHPAAVGLPGPAGRLAHGARATSRATIPQDVGAELAEQLLDWGGVPAAGAVSRAPRGPERPLAGRRVLVTRARGPVRGPRRRAARAGRRGRPRPAARDRAARGPAPVPGRRSARSTATTGCCSRARTRRTRVAAALGPRAGPAGDACALASSGPATTAVIRSLFPGPPITAQATSRFGSPGLAEALALVDVSGARMLLPVSDRSPAAIGRDPARRAGRGSTSWSPTGRSSDEAAGPALRAALDARASTPSPLHLLRPSRLSSALRGMPVGRAGGRHRSDDRRRGPRARA